MARKYDYNLKVRITERMRRDLQTYVSKNDMTMSKVVRQMIEKVLYGVGVEVVVRDE